MGGRLRETDMSYHVRILKVGEVEVPGPEVFWMSQWDTWLPLSIDVLVIQGRGVTALVNTGAPEDLSPINEMWMSVLGERGLYRRSPEQAQIGCPRCSRRN